MGQPAPGAQTVMMRVAPAGARVEVRTTNPWLIIQPSGQALNVRVDPGSLAAGVHQAVARVRASGLERMMRVELTVKRPEGAPPPPPLTTPAKPPEAAPPKPAAETGSPEPDGPWTFDKRGTVVWNGALAPDARIVLGWSRIIDGGGATGDYMLPRNLTVDEMPPGLVVEIGPYPNPRRVTIINKTGRVVPQIRLPWRLKQ
jgi:hypothetical protein